MRQRLLFTTLVVLFSCGPQPGNEPAVSQHEALTAVTGFGSNPGGLSLFIYTPTGLSTNVPLVVALHGCGQTADGYTTAGWDALADQHRFLVAYPQTTANSACFDWFSANQQTRSGPQVTSILQMVQHLVATRGVDATRVSVTGLSAGGAMTDVLLAVAPDVFSRGAVMAGLPFACGLTCISSPTDQTPAQWGALVRAVSGANPAPRVSLWHGMVDSTVRPGNLQEQVDQWTDVNGIDTTADATTTVGIATRSEFKNGAGVTLVESWSLAGMNHGTPIDTASGCGTASPFILDVGVCSSRFAAEFFGLIAANDGGVTGGGGGSATGGGGGGGATGGGGGSATGGGGGGSASGGGGGTATGGGGTALGGGSAQGGGGAVNPVGGCGCAGIDPLAVGLVGLLLLRRRRG